MILISQFNISHYLMMGEVDWVISVMEMMDGMVVLVNMAMAVVVVVISEILMMTVTCGHLE